jgi:hypothetical protein
MQVCASKDGDKILRRNQVRCRALPCWTPQALKRIEAAYLEGEGIPESNKQVTNSDLFPDVLS